MRVSGRIVVVLVALMATGVQAADSVEAKPSPMQLNATPDRYTALAQSVGMVAAPGLLSKARIRCEVSEAADVGRANLVDATGKKVGVGHTYELGCHDDLGYLITDRGDTPALVKDCIAAQMAPTTCGLAANVHPADGLRRYLDEAGRACEPSGARAIGEDARERSRRYEVLCKSGGGYILHIPMADGSGLSSRAADCLVADGECRLTPHLEAVAVLASKIGRVLAETCDMSDARYLGQVSARKSNLYEVSCHNGQEGQLVELDTLGAFVSARPCSAVKLAGAACQLMAAATIDPMVASAQASGVPPTPSVITTPPWSGKPTAADFARVYPDRAERLAVSGRATLRCIVTSVGSLAGCRVVDEAPDGFDFGAAALKLVPEFHMQLHTRDGRSASGAAVTLPIRFSVSH